MLTTILTILGTLVPTILSNSGVIGTGTATLISSLYGPVASLFTSLASGATKTQDALSVLGAMQGVIAVLKATPNMPAATLTEIGGIESDVQAALAAYVKAEGGLDLTVYSQIAPVA
jgi:hypothetical protein